MQNINSIIKIVREVLHQEIYGLEQLVNNLPIKLGEVILEINNMQGKLITSGIGKSGYIARKIAASFSSIGTVSIYVHPAEASHGDLGIINDKDLVILLSNSGETKELLDIVNYCKRFKIKLVTMTMNPNSTIAKTSDFVLNIPKISEASLVDAPTTSALMMLALGDAIMVSVQELKGFTKENFQIFHPGGKIGASLIRVKAIMHTGSKLPVVKPDSLVSDVLITMTSSGFGCAVVTKDNTLVIGVITDGDLRRHMSEKIIALKAHEIMTTSPITITSNVFSAEALSIMNNNKITTLLVVEDNRLLGIVHMHDLLRIGVV